mgnify:CR=1 FL=1
MMELQNALIVDLDNTIAFTTAGGYENSVPCVKTVEKLREYRQKGFRIIIHTSRNMKTFAGNIGLINKNTAPSVIEWLDEHEVPFDEIYFGKPWCGPGGFYVDDKAIRPDELVNLSYPDIQKLLNSDYSN